MGAMMTQFENNVVAPECSQLKFNNFVIGSELPLSSFGAHASRDLLGRATIYGRRIRANGRPLEVRSTFRTSVEPRKMWSINFQVDGERVQWGKRLDAEIE